MSNIDKHAVQAVADLKVGYTLGHADVAILNELARIALASLEVEPVAYMYKDNLHADARFSLHTRFGNWSQEDINEYEITEIPLYTATPAPVSVPDAIHSQGEKSASDDYYALGWNACRAAMLQGSEPVSQPYTLREVLAAIRNSGIAIDAEKIQAERDALNEPDVPDGYALVPLEPTAEMVAAAMLSNDVLFDQDDDTMFRVQHGVIWRAMLAAAPDFLEISNSSTKHFRENAETSTKCWCHACRPVTMNDARFVVCPDCGNKRCPHANDHQHACTGSNEPGQEGSAYPAAPQQEVKP